nr:hypothetical protein [Tanacetum cinerariifolium]
MKGVRSSVIIGGDKVVTWSASCSSSLQRGDNKELDKVVNHSGESWLEGIVDITEFFRKLKFICHWADPFKDLKRSNVSEVKLSSLFKLDDTFLSLKALSYLYYLFSGFMYYLWSHELNISNFGPADRVITNALIQNGLICSFWLKASAMTFAFPECLLTLVVGQIVPAFLKELICKVFGLLVPFLELKSIWNSTWRIRGRPGRSLGKTSGNSLTTENFGMTLEQPIQTNDDVETTEFNRYEINFESISPEGFLPFILLLVVIIVAVSIIVEGFKVVTFPSMLLGNPPMKTSMSFLELGTIVRHKTARSWNLLLRENTNSVHSNKRMRPIAPSVPLKLIVFAMVAACISRAVAALSATVF